MSRRRPPRATSVLTPADLVAAETFWVKKTKEEFFSKELQLLSQGHALPRNAALLRLAPFVDQNGLIRIGGRLRNAPLDPSARHPILLPRSGPFVTLVLDDIHRRTLHGGTQLMLATLRENFWTLGGRAPVKAFVHRCVRCARYRAATAQQLMGQLPATRVTPARPFLHASVDYAGPFHLKTWRGRASRTYKGFLVVFVCFATSAVHLELATDYTTQAFLAAYKRFTGRRGICASLTSDCGPNLVGADAELRKLFDAASSDLKNLAHTIAADGTEWRFNPPSAPHFGGKWEAAVKSVKFHLRRVLGDTVLTYEEFSTVLVQIEAILNSRPLGVLSDDPDDLQALTPAHFLVGAPLTTVPEPSLATVSLSYLSRWQLIRNILDRLWKRWSMEYLQRLQEISKWQHPTKDIQPGSIVLIKDERLPPAKWSLASVTETHPGTDGLIRVATVRTGKTEYKRPIVKLCLLPILSP